jgi:hypothetical protein
MLAVIGFLAFLLIRIALSAKKARQGKTVRKGQPNYLSGIALIVFLLGMAIWTVWAHR